ncbi:MAG: SEL1-like repeat protein [Deltaproteobacteria bacterium]|nr:SEL1-like repeat protein [Deltaproteobacteria bacterium]
MRLLVAILTTVACQGNAPVTTTVAPVGSAAPTPCDGAACERSCLANDAVACARAAELFFDGKNGHPLDMARSFRYAKQACEAGVLTGCTMLGFHYQDGLGTAWSPESAIATYEQACTAGAGTSCYNLASMYSGGHGVVVDLARADALNARAGLAWNAACKGTEPRWCTNAAFLLATGGEPTAAVKETMLALDQRACDARVLVGCVEAARLKLQLGRLEPTAYIAELDRLCTAGETTGCMVAGATLVAGQRIAKDVRRGMALVARSCELGDKDGCMAMATEAVTGELVPRDDAAALRFLTMACDRGARGACFTIAEGHHAQGKLEQAMQFARRACQMGHAEACGTLAAAAHAGTGVPRSDADAVRWAHAACRGGLGTACGILIERDLDLPIPAKHLKGIYEDACAHQIKPACARLTRLP